MWKKWFLQVIIEMSSNKTRSHKNRKNDKRFKFYFKILKKTTWPTKNGKDFRGVKLVQRRIRKNICTEYDHFSKRNAKAIKNLFFFREYGNKMLENIKIKLNRLCKNSSTKKFLVKADEKLLGKSDENFKLVKDITRKAFL